MDWTALSSRTMEWIQKYRFLLLVLFLGILLMTLPTHNPPKEETVVESVIQEDSLEERLAASLSMMEGAGKVRVLLTEAKGAQTLYQSDNSGERTETVILNDGSRIQTGLVRRVDPPEYLGAVVLCQGAGKASVRLAVVEAVSNATGLSYDRISVFKLK